MALGTGISGGLGGAGVGLAIGGPIGAGIGGLLGLIGGASEDQTDPAELMRQAGAQFQGVSTPDILKAIAYQQYQSSGALTPQQLSQLPIEQQAAIQLQENPEMRQKQMAQLQAMQQLAQTGMGPQERLAMAEATQRAGQESQARNAAILNQFQQRGQAGGGGALAAMLSGQQQTSQNEMMANLQAAAQAAQTRQSAIAQAMQGASGLRAQDLGVQESNVAAQRQRQLFDIQNQMARQQANAQYANQANLYNLQNQQNIMNQNAQQANQELYRQGYLAPQQQFQNQMSLAAGKAGIYGQQANLAQQQNQAQAQNWANLAGSGMQLGAYGMKYGPMINLGGNSALNSKYDPNKPFSSSNMPGQSMADYQNIE